VRSGEITIEPENNRQIYLNWMDNIHDWCISRQLWWGHRIPAWHCKCGEVIVSRETPTKCTKCDGELEQDRDVLDTWFSSGLLPFTTLGWPNKTRDLEVFYPTALMITGFDILFFWLARMIMFGCHFMQGNKQDTAVRSASGWKDRKDDGVPFRRVYIHALVRDARGEKMSKMKGNVVDPLDVVKRFGTDAARFTLAAMAAPGTDVAFSESRTEGYRNFANKIWNAARFMFMNVDRISPDLKPERGRVETELAPSVFFKASTLEDRWILSRFNRTAKEVGEALETFRFHEASNRIYDFFWGEFCDWYLELIKPRLNSDSNAQEACANLVNLFEASLRLLHPVMPFITEEIWHAMYAGKPPLKSLAFAAYPQENTTQIDLAAETDMAILQDLIVSIRNLRAELKVEPKGKVPVQVYFHDAATKTLILRNRIAVEQLANVSEITEVAQDAARQSPTRGTTRFDVRVIYEKKVDVAAECERLKKELEKIEKEMANNQRQLSNEQFLAKAPANVVEGMRKRAGELVVLRDKALSQTKELGCK
jgi:valyl-tRNA synthetase